MRVKYIGINDPLKGSQTSSERLTINNEYIVIELLSSVKKGVLYRLVGENLDSSPAVFSATEFEIISNSVPANWTLTIKNNGLMVNGPAAWREPEFWEKCYDGNPAALEIYKREARIIFDE
jgi:hypothetical protein